MRVRRLYTLIPPAVPRSRMNAPAAISESASTSGRVAIPSAPQASIPPQPPASSPASGSSNTTPRSTSSTTEMRVEKNIYHDPRTGHYRVMLQVTTATLGEAQHVKAQAKPLLAMGVPPGPKSGSTNSRTYQPGSKDEFYNLLRKAGVCVNCRQADAIPGRCLCQSCRLHRRAKYSAMKGGDLS